MFVAIIFIIKDIILEFHVVSKQKHANQTYALQKICNFTVSDIGDLSN